MKTKLRTILAVLSCLFIISPIVFSNIPPPEEVKNYKRAALQGDALAQCNLGSCYYNGYGVEKNPQEAVRWYKKAAEQGEAEALLNLGICYMIGVGVEKKSTRSRTMLQEGGGTRARNSTILPWDLLR